MGNLFCALMHGKVQRFVHDGKEDARTRRVDGPGVIDKQRLRELMRGSASVFGKVTV